MRNDNVREIGKGYFVDLHNNDVVEQVIVAHIYCLEVVKQCNYFREHSVCWTELGVKGKKLMIQNSTC